MRNKLLAITGVIMLALFTFNATCEGCVTVSQDRETYVVDQSGCVDY